MKSEIYEYALKLSKICVDLCPESFEAWILLAECYFHVKRFKMSLICLDIAPLYTNSQYIHEVKTVADYDMTQPKLKNSSDMHPYIMLEPTKIDIRKPHESIRSLVNMVFNEQTYKPWPGELNAFELNMLEKLKKVNNI